MHDLAAEKGNLFEVIERLHSKIPNIVDLRKVGDALFVFYKDGKKVPLETMGDGFKASVLVSLAAQTLSKGVLILEEPENYLHPGLMMHLIDELISANVDRNIQIFLSTHSEEFMKFILERSKKSEVSIVRMTGANELLEAEIISRKDAEMHMNELGIDLRGF